MGYIKYFQFAELLKKNQIANIYYFCGEEHLLIDEFLNQLQETISTEISDKEILYGTTFEINKFFDLIYSYSLFGTKKRLVVVKEANKIKKSTETAILQLLSNQKISSYIVFINPEKIKFDELKSNPLLNFISNTGEVVEFSPVSCHETIKFIMNEFSKNKKNISSDAAEQLYELTGNNLYDIKNEIEKLVLLLKDKTEVTQEDILFCSGVTKQENVYRLADLVLSKNHNEAILLLNKLIQNGIEPLYILNVLYRTYRRALIGYSLLKTNYSEESIIKKLKLNRKVAENFLDNVKNYTEDEFIKKLNLIYGTELAIKSGKVENTDLQLLVSKLAVRAE